MKHTKTAVALLLISATTIADNVKVTVPSNALKAAVDKETGRLRQLSDEEQQTLQSQSVSARINAGLNAPTVSISKTGVGETEKAELGLSVLDELIVQGKDVEPTHRSTATSIVVEDK